MKKILFLSVLFLISVISTGCVRIAYDIDVNSKGEVSITENRNLVYGMDVPEDLKLLLGNNMQDYAKLYIKEGFEVQSSSERNGASMVISKKKLDFLEASKFLPSGFKKDTNKSFSVKHSLFKNTYTINLVYSKKDLLKSEREKWQCFSFLTSMLDPAIGYLVVSSSSYNDPNNGIIITTNKFLNGQCEITSMASKQSTGYITYKPELKIKIPVEAKNNNANSVQMGNVYVWDLSDADLPISIYLEYEQFNLIAMVVFISILILVFLVFVISKKLNDEPPISGM